jgi:hypothetical protein
MGLNRIEIYKNNVGGYVMFNEAVEICKNLGDGWRLPTIEESRVMFNDHQKKIVTFGNYGIWCSTEYDNNSIWSKGLKTGNEYINPKTNINLIRPVRTIKFPEKEYWSSLNPPLSPSEKDVKIFKKYLINGTTLLLGCTKELVHLSDTQMDLNPFDSTSNVIIQDWLTNTNPYTNIIGDGVFNFTKELCDGVIDMASKCSKKLIVRSFNKKMDIMRIAENFPTINDFKLKPTLVHRFNDYTFFIWEF